MSNRTSITERLKKSRRRQARLDFAHDWATEWEQKYVELMMALQKAIQEGDTDKIIRVLGDLRGLNQPKFAALHNVIDELTNPSRELIDD